MLDLLKEARMLACKPANTPIEVNHQLGNEDGTLHTLGCFPHASPGIAYEVSVIIQ